MNFKAIPLQSLKQKRAPKLPPLQDPLQPNIVHDPSKDLAAINHFFNNLPKKNIAQFTQQFLNSNNKGQPTGSTAIVAGSSKSGKTFLMVQILLEMFKDAKFKKVLVPVVVTPNFYSPAYDDLHSLEAAGKILVIDKVKELPKAARRMFTINKHCGNHYKFILFIDDVVSSELQRGNIIEDLFLTMRNNNISTIMGVQTETIAGKKSRSNANFLLFKRFNTDLEVEAMVEKYFQGFFPDVHQKSKKMLNQLYNDMIDDYHTIMVDSLEREIFDLF